MLTLYIQGPLIPANFGVWASCLSVCTDATLKSHTFLSTRLHNPRRSIESRC